MNAKGRKAVPAECASEHEYQEVAHDTLAKLGVYIGLIPGPAPDERSWVQSGKVCVKCGKITKLMHIEKLKWQDEIQDKRQRVKALKTLRIIAEEKETRGWP